MTPKIPRNFFSTATKRLAFATALVFFLGSNLEATFPSKLVAHGDPLESDEYHDPDFAKVHDLVKAGRINQALDILEIKSKNLDIVKPISQLNKVHKVETLNDEEFKIAKEKILK